MSGILLWQPLAHSDTGGNISQSGILSERRKNWEAEGQAESMLILDYSPKHFIVNSALLKVTVRLADHEELEI